MTKEPLCESRVRPTVISIPKRICTFMFSTIFITLITTKHVENLCVFLAQSQDPSRPRPSQLLIHEKSITYVCLLPEIPKQSAQYGAILDGLCGALCTM